MDQKNAELKTLFNERFGIDCGIVCFLSSRLSSKDTETAVDDAVIVFNFNLE